ANARAASSMSSKLQRARAQMIGPRTSRATACTDSKSPREAAGKPASMTSTPSSASARATRSVSGRVMLQPGDCSPSRSVVSKISTRSGLAIMGTPSERQVHSPLRTLLVEPGHARPQRRTDLLDLPIDVLTEEPLVVGAAGRVFADPLARELAALHFLEHLAHLVLHALIDDARTAGEIAVLGGLADELMHLGEPTLVQQVDDQLQLVQALVVGNLGLIARLHEGLEALHHELGGAAAQHRLLAEQIRLGLLGKAGLEHPAARAADAVRVGEGACVRLAAGILGDREQTRHAAPLAVLAADQVAGSLGGDKHHVEIRARFDLAEMDVEAVREQQRGAALEALPDALVEILLRQVRHQHGDHVRPGHGEGGLGDLEAVAARFLPAHPALAHTDHDVAAAVLEVQGVSPPLAAVAEDGDARPLEGFLVHVLLRVQPHLTTPRGLMALVAPIKNPAAALSRCGVLVS